MAPPRCQNPDTIFLRGPMTDLPVGSDFPHGRETAGGHELVEHPAGDLVAGLPQGFGQRLHLFDRVKQTHPARGIFVIPHRARWFTHLFKRFRQGLCTVIFGKFYPIQGEVPDDVEGAASEVPGVTQPGQVQTQAQQGFLNQVFGIGVAEGFKQGLSTPEQGRTQLRAQHGQRVTVPGPGATEQLDFAGVGGAVRVAQGPIRRTPDIPGRAGFVTARFVWIAGGRTSLGLWGVTSGLKRAWKEHRLLMPQQLNRDGCAVASNVPAHVLATRVHGQWHLWLYPVKAGRGANLTNFFL